MNLLKQHFPLFLFAFLCFSLCFILFNIRWFILLSLLLVEIILGNMKSFMKFLLSLRLKRRKKIYYILLKIFELDFMSGFKSSSASRTLRYIIQMILILDIQYIWWNSINTGSIYQTYYQNFTVIVHQSIFFSISSFNFLIKEKQIFTLILCSALFNPQLMRWKWSNSIILFNF